MRRVAVVLFALLLLCLARDGAAQGFINPFVGTTLTSPSKDSSRSKAGFGVAFGGIGNVFGAETEIAYYPEILRMAATDQAKNKVVTFSGNLLLGPTIGPIKVYGAGGMGNLLLNVTSVSGLISPTAASISNNFLAFNGGGGVMIFLGNHLGVRGDLRYYRALGFKLADGQAAGIAVDRFDFWRATVGLAAKF